MRFSISVAMAGALIPMANSGAVAQPAPRTDLSKGAYLVDIIGCGDCHTPRGPKGEVSPGKALAGAPLGFAPTAPMPWAPYAPALAGGPAGYDEASLAALLHVGKRKDGSMARPPMPGFHMTPEDARAVARYIYSLKKPG